MKVRLVMAAIAAIPSVTCFGGLFDNALKAVSDTAKAVTASPAETREEAERDRQKALLEESERIKAEDRKKIEAEEEARRQQREKEYAERKAKRDAEEAARKARREQREKECAERKAKRDAEEAARKARQEQEEKNRLAKEQQDCQSRLVMACVVAERGNKGNVYVDAGLRNSFKGSVQYESNSLIRTHVPLYKEISSGSSVGWVIDNGYLSEKLGRINVSPFIIPEVNYRGCLFDIDKGVGLCCAVSKAAKKPIVEVWGMRKEFPKTATVKEVIEKLQKKYQGLKLNESQEDDEFLCMDFVGFSKKVSRRKIQFENGDLQGSCVGEEFQFNKVDWNSGAAAMWICGGVSEYLRKENSFKHAEFEKAFGECTAAVRAEVKSGKCQKDIASFKVKFGNGNGGAEYEGELAYIMLETAKRTLKERAFWNKKDIERVKNELIAASAQMEAQLGQAASAGTLAKGPVLVVYDKTAVSVLVDAEKKRDDARKAEAQKKKEAEEAAALDF